MPKKVAANLQRLTFRIDWFHMEMDIGQAIGRLESGYGLWVGAGLTRQIAAGHMAVPL